MFGFFRVLGGIFLIFLGFFLDEFLGESCEDFFVRMFLEGSFWEDFLERIFWGGFFWEDFFRRTF